MLFVCCLCVGGICLLFADCCLVFWCLVSWCLVFGGWRLVLGGVWRCLLVPGDRSCLLVCCCSLFVISCLLLFVGVCCVLLGVRWSLFVVCGLLLVAW